MSHPAFAPRTAPTQSLGQQKGATDLTLLIPVVAFFGAIYIAFGAYSSGPKNDLSEEAAARRVQRVGTLAFTAPAPAATDASAAAASPGEALYTSTCQACHGTGVIGSPKFGDKTAWAPRLATGVDALLNSALNGKNAMPPKGGSTASDADVKAAVEYMLAAVK